MGDVIDVTGGLKIVLQKLESSFAARSKVREVRCSDAERTCKCVRYLSIYVRMIGGPKSSLICRKVRSKCPQIIKYNLLKLSYLIHLKDLLTRKPQLVAVSKTKPVEAIIEAYSAGQHHFGENYAKELAEKRTHKLITDSCPDIKWHFIGHLQRNNINRIISLPGLYMVETVDNEKLASALDKAWQTRSGSPDKLKVLVQVNTSQEENKSGINPAEVTTLYK